MGLGLCSLQHLFHYFLKHTFVAPFLQDNLTWHTGKSTTCPLLTSDTLGPHTANEKPTCPEAYDEDDTSGSLAHTPHTDASPVQHKSTRHGTLSGTLVSSRMPIVCFMAFAGRISVRVSVAAGDRGRVPCRTGPRVSDPVRRRGGRCVVRGLGRRVEAARSRREWREVGVPKGIAAVEEGIGCLGVLYCCLPDSTPPPRIPFGLFTHGRS